MATPQRRKRRPSSRGRDGAPAPGPPAEAGVGSAPGEAAAPRSAGAAAAPREVAAPRPAAVAAAPGEAAAPAAAASRSAVRDQAARLALAPLAPGERPPALVVAVAVTALLGAGNAIAYAAGAKIGGHRPGPGVLVFSVAMALLAGGMWTRRYLAVLACEALIAIVVLVFSLFLVEAGNIEGALLCLAVIVAGGWLFWKLVRVIGRLAAARQSSP